MALSVELVTSLKRVQGQDWDALTAPDEPFMAHAFLSALEDSGSVGAKAGWEPAYVLVKDGAALVGAAAAYLKTNSYGEYIFDWAWADAFYRQGQNYYPKLVVAAPFTPATGRRLLMAPGADETTVRAALVGGLLNVVEQTGASSLHVLFTPQTEMGALGELGFIERYSMQFHWHNAGYGSFGDYLDALTSKRRKEIRRERRQVTESGAEIMAVPGTDVAKKDWEHLYHFYRSTVSMKGAYPYLTPEFFELLPERLGHRTLLFLAKRGGGTVAGTLNFQKGSHLYGRYWGASEDLPCLHFETCYYAPIEHAITHGLSRYEAGAQGEHKLSRGFLPTLTYSAHHIAHPDFGRAIRRFTRQEKAHVLESVAYYTSHSPFREDA